MAEAKRDPDAGDRLRRAMESSPGWRGAAALERDSGVSAQSIGAWFRGAPPKIENIVKVAPFLKRAPLEFYAAWFNEPLASSGLERIANEISELRDAILARALRRVGDVERRDWPLGRDRGQEADDEPDGEPGKRPA